MTRVLRLTRLSPFLILAAALVALAVFFVNYNAPPASADHTSDEVIWSATLTLQDTGSGVPGCLNDLSETAKKCSTSTTLTNYQIRTTALAEDVTIRGIYLSSSGLEFHPSTSGQRNALQPHALLVDGVYFRFADASAVGTGSRWSSPGITWSVGNSVELKLVKRYWTGVDLYNGDADDDLELHSDGALTMDVTKAADGSGTFKVRLTQAPTANVTITFSKLATAFGIDDFDAVTVSPETLTFSTSNWQTGQEATVSATTDAAGGDSIIISAAVSIAGTANANDPYRNPDRRNGFVVTVKAGGL